MRIETQKHNGESYVKIEAEWELWSYKPRIAGNHQKLGERHETVSLSEPPEGTNPVNTLILDFWPSHICWRINIYCFKPPWLW